MYEPAEDTWLLCDSLAAEQEALRNLAPAFAVEIGYVRRLTHARYYTMPRHILLYHCVPMLPSSLHLLARPGSGAVSTYLAGLLEYLHQHTLVLGIDINPAATQALLHTARAAQVSPVEAVQTSLTSGMQRRLHEAVDVLVFNPPYVPTPDEEVGTADLSAAWAGGHRGRVVIDQFLPLAVDMLAPGGILYLLLVAANQPAEVMHILSTHGLTAEVRDVAAYLAEGCQTTQSCEHFVVPALCCYLAACSHRSSSRLKHTMKGYVLSKLLNLCLRHDASRATAAHAALPARAAGLVAYLPVHT